MGVNEEVFRHKKRLIMLRFDESVREVVGGLNAGVEPMPRQV